MIWWHYNITTTQMQHAGYVCVLVNSAIVPAYICWFSFLPCRRLLGVLLKENIIMLNIFPLSGSCISTEQFTCFNNGSANECIPYEQRCDGTANCKQGEDEEICCRESSFGCYVDVSDHHDSYNGVAGSQLVYQCLEPLSRCNGVPDCEDRSDETNCKLKLPYLLILLG